MCNSWAEFCKKQWVEFTEIYTPDWGGWHLCHFILIQTIKYLHPRASCFWAFREIGLFLGSFLWYTAFPLKNNKRTRINTKNIDDMQIQHFFWIWLFFTVSCTSALAELDELVHESYTWVIYIYIDLIHEVNGVLINCKCWIEVVWN